MRTKPVKKLGADPDQIAVASKPPVAVAQLWIVSRVALMGMRRVQLGSAAGIMFLWFLAGCGGTRVKPLSDGYEEVAVTYRGMGEPEMTQHKLAHRDTQGRQVVIWPWVFSDVFIHDGVAVFLGENPDHAVRLFAVKPPELPLDITSQVVGGWVQESGKDVPKAQAAATPIGGKQTGDGNLEFYFEFSGGIWPGTNLPVKWNQIPNMMRHVKTYGVEGKDRKFGRYLTEEAKPELRSPR
jgi:hypothetical protein